MRTHIQPDKALRLAGSRRVLAELCTAPGEQQPTRQAVSAWLKSGALPASRVLVLMAKRPEWFR